MKMPVAKSSSGRSRKRSPKSRDFRNKRITSNSAKKAANTKKPNSSAISARTKKQIASLPEHAQHIYKQAHANALKQYDNPAKRRGGKSQNKEQVAHKVAWSAVKRQYEKSGADWVKKS